MEPLSVAVIGCGGHGRGHIQTFAKLPQARLVAVADINGERAREAAACFGVPHYYSDYGQLLSRHRPDIVSLALPPTANVAAARAAFAVGSHVLASKPLAPSLEQAQDIVKAAQEAGRLLSMALQNRFKPEVQALRQVVQGGRLGRVYHARLWHGHEMNIPASPSLHRRRLAGGGVVLHTMVHLLDAVLWALGNPRAVRVAAASYQKLARMQPPPASWEGDVAACDIEDFNIGLVHFADGSTMTIESNWLMHPRSRPSGAEILADQGTASLRPLRVELEERGEVVEATPDLPEEEPDAFALACLDLCQSIVEKRLPLVRCEQMLGVQQIMDGLYASAAAGRQVDLSQL